LISEAEQRCQNDQARILEDFFHKKKNTTVDQKRGVMLYVSDLRRKVNMSGAEEGDVRKQNSYYTRLKHFFFFLLHLFLWKKSEPSQRGRTKEKKRQQQNPGN
jgi:hypothetical protein